MAGFRKSIKGDNNDQVESLSHNRITIEGGSAALVLVVFFCILATAAIIMMSVTHLDIVETLILVTFVGFFVGLWVVGMALIWRQISAARTATTIDAWARTRAAAEAGVAHATDHYILWRDPDGNYQFRGSTIITENRQFLPTQISPPSQQEAILASYDSGLSGRAIEKHLNSVAKDAGSPKVSYREISKTLDLYRPDWNKKATVKSDVIGDESD